jgi:hypothetical protein
VTLVITVPPPPAQKGEREKMSVSEDKIIIDYYKLTKGGVNSLDEECANYCTGCSTRRWPIIIFYRILDDVSGVNSFILYNS